MDDVTRYRFEELCPTGETMVMGSDFDAALSREASLREELARSRKGNGDLVDRLTAAEQRNANLAELLGQARGMVNGASEKWHDLVHDALLYKPTESGASE